MTVVRGFLLCLMACSGALLLRVSSVQAQDAPPPPPASFFEEGAESVPVLPGTDSMDQEIDPLDADSPQAEGGPLSAQTRNLRPESLRSILYTHWEHESIDEARRSIGSVRPTTEQEFSEKQEPIEEKVKPPPEKRYISLGGIAYVDADDWTIWLNGQRVTPEALPREIIDLRVFKEYIEMKWYDDYSNQIFPLRLRANQRFNVDTRIFLPG